MVQSIDILNESAKYRSYGVFRLNYKTSKAAIEDFNQIFLNQKRDVVFQLLTIYSGILIINNSNKSVYRDSNDTDEEYNLRLEDCRYKQFDNFAEHLNDVFEQFGVNVILTRVALVPRQDKKIVDEIIVPVFNFLSHSRFEKVSQNLRDAFNAFQIKTKAGYSNAITLTIVSIEAFLQILIYGEVNGIETLGKLLPKAIARKSIPNDSFTRTIFNNIESVLAQERKKKGVAHPKEEYANEQSCRLVINLAMVFMQHCMQNVK